MSHFRRVPWCGELFFHFYVFSNEHLFLGSKGFFFFGVLLNFGVEALSEEKGVDIGARCHAAPTDSEIHLLTSHVEV